MNLEVPRFLEKFTNVAGSVSYTFPKNQYSLDHSQPLRTSLQQIIGANYPVDLLGFGPAPKDAGKGSHRAFIVGAPGTGGDDVDDEIDVMRHKLFSIGQGKLYTVDSSSAERWAYARLLSMPSSNWKTGDFDHIAMSLDWSIQSDWYDASAYASDFAIASDPQTITVPNSGSTRVFNAVITLKGPWNHPSITNSTNGYAVSNSRVGASSANWLKIDAGLGVVLFSLDTGVTFNGDFVNVTLPTSQVQLMVLEPGNNSIIVTGCNGGTVSVSFYPASD